MYAYSDVIQRASNFIIWWLTRVTVVIFECFKFQINEKLYPCDGMASLGLNLFDNLRILIRRIIILLCRRLKVFQLD